MLWIFLCIAFFFFLRSATVGGQDLSFCIGLKTPFTNNNVSEEEKALGKAP